MLLGVTGYEFYQGGFDAVGLGFVCCWMKARWVAVVVLLARVFLCNVLACVLTLPVDTN